jgi:hypothetical protein
MTPHRRYLGADHDMAGRKKVFRLPDALETDEGSFIRIERTRVYFDDVLAITRHRQLGLGFLIFNGLLGGGFLIGAVSAWVSTSVPGLFIFLGIDSLPFVLAFILRLLLGVDVITVYGRRTMTRMRYFFRKGRAREVFEDLTREIEARQQKAALAAAPPPAPPPEGPPPPPAAAPA